MFWKRSINKIFFTTLIVFIAFILFSFSKTSVDNESFSSSSYRVPLYTINEDSYVSMTSVFLDGDTLEEKISNVIDIMVNTYSYANQYDESEHSTFDGTKIVYTIVYEK